MSLKLSGLTPPAPIELPSMPSTGAATGSSAGTSFKDILGSAIKTVEGARSDANQSVDRFLSGEGDDLHSVILSTQRADLEFQMFLQVRNKVVSAYQEVMRMQM
jgi:flagellar hook-basal body complex protein FliE